MYGPIWRVKLKPWLNTLPGLVLSTEITSVSLSPSLKAVEIPNPFTVVAPPAATRLLGLLLVRKLTNLKQLE